MLPDFKVALDKDVLNIAVEWKGIPRFASRSRFDRTINDSTVQRPVRALIRSPSAIGLGSQTILGVLQFPE